MLKFNNIVLKYNGHWLTKTEEAPDYNPLGLPPNTVRVRTSDGHAPIKGASTSYETATLVPGTTDVYDVYKSGTDFTYLLIFSTNVVEVLGANTADITNMTAMLGGCTSLTTVPLFDTSSTTNMSNMFSSTSLTTIPLFNTSNVTNMNSMFRNCSSLTTVPLFDTSSTTDIGNMFNGCTSLTTVPLFDTSNVTLMYSTFEGCTSLTTVPLFDTSSTINMSQMFNGCTSLTTVPLFDTSNVTDMVSMIRSCSSLTTVPLFNTSKVTRMETMFMRCYKVQSGALALYQQASSQATPPSQHSNTFYECGRDTVTGAAELAQIPSSWGGTGT